MAVVHQQLFAFAHRPQGAKSAFSRIGGAEGHVGLLFLRVVHIPRGVESNKAVGGHFIHEVSLRVGPLRLSTLVRIGRWKEAERMLIHRLRQARKLSDRQ